MILLIVLIVSGFPQENIAGSYIGQVAEWLKALVSKATNFKLHHEIINKYQTVKIVNLSVLYLHMCYTLFVDGVYP